MPLSDLAKIPATWSIMRPLCDSWASGFARCLIILQRYLSPADFLPMHLYACLWLVRVKQKASLFRDTVSTDLHIISSQQTPAYTVTQCTRLLPCFRWYSYSYPQKDGQAKLTWVAGYTQRWFATFRRLPIQVLIQPGVQELCWSRPMHTQKLITENCMDYKNLYILYVEK